MKRFAAGFALVMVGCSNDPDPDGVGGGDIEPAACDYLEFQEVIQTDQENRAAGQCVSIPLTPYDGDRVNCVVLEARAPGPPCEERVGRDPVAAEHEHLVELVKAGLHADPDAVYCELRQLRGADQDACQSEEGAINPGFCYLRADVEPIIGDLDIVASCPDARLLRLAGDAGQVDSLLYFFCDDSAVSCE
jgi:hypothetical protein